MCSFRTFLSIFWPDWSKVNADDHFDDDDHRRILSLCPPPNSRPLPSSGHRQVKLWRTTIFIKIAKVCLWFRPRRHLYEHLQSSDRKRRRLSSNAFWNFDRGSIFCRWSGGLLAVTGEQIVLATIISRNTALGVTEAQKISGSSGKIELL